MAYQLEIFLLIKDPSKFFTTDHPNGAPLQVTLNCSGF